MEHTEARILATSTPLADYSETLTEPSAAEFFEVPPPDAVELRRMLKAIRMLSREDVSRSKIRDLWQPVSAGGHIRFDHYQALLLASLRAQVPGAIRRVRASKPVSYRTRKIVEALLALETLREHKRPAQ